MKRIGPIALIIICSLASGYVAWRISRPKPQQMDVYGDQGVDLGFDRAWYQKLGKAIEAGSEGQCKDIMPADYEDVYTALQSRKSLAQLDALVVLSNCPPSDKTTWISRINMFLQSTSDTGLQLAGYSALWNIDLAEHEKIRAQAMACNLPEVAKVVSHWPDRRLTQTDH